MKLRKLFLSLASLAVLAGCNNKEEVEAAPSMTLDPETLSFENVAGEQRVKITSNVDWTVSDIPSWITVNPTSGTASEESVFVSVEVGNNVDRTERKATLKFASDKVSKTLAVTQKAADAAFSVSEKTFSVEAEAGEVKFNVKSNVKWTVISDNEVFTVTPASGTGDGEVTVKYPENTSVRPVVATVKVSTEEAVTPNFIDVVITQKAAAVKFNVSQREFSAKREAGEVKFNVISNVAWTVVSDNEAFTVTPASGTGDGEVTVKYPENTSVQPVVATVKVSTEESVIPSFYEVVITQDAADVIFDVPVREVSVPADGGDVKFNVLSNINWRVTSDNAEFKVSPETGSGNGEVTVTCPPNTTSAPVTEYVYVKSVGAGVTMTFRVEIKQDAGGASGKVDILTPAALGLTVFDEGGPFENVSENFAAAYSGVLKVNMFEPIFEFISEDNFYGKYGVFSSKSGGKVKKVTFISPENAHGEIQIYCRNTPYTSVEDLFNAPENEIVSVISIEKGITETSFEIPGDFQHIGIKTTKKGTSFSVSTIEITWE